MKKDAGLRVHINPNGGKFKFIEMESENSAVEIMEYAEKSICERKQYRIIRLANDMKVMLVHDDQVHEDDYEVYWPICCLAISVGSLSDPDDLPGLARYVGNVNCAYKHTISFCFFVIRIVLKFRFPFQHTCFTIAAPNSSI